MPRPDADVVALLEEWLDLARCGDLRDVLLVGHFSDGSYDPSYALSLTEDMIFELRTVLIRLRSRLAAHDCSGEEKNPEG